MQSPVFERGSLLQLVSMKAGRLSTPVSDPDTIAELLADHDINVNCILQDIDDPMMFVTSDELELFAPGSLFVDVSCDEGMGFDWARPTSFAQPMLSVGSNLHRYAVDHSPSLLCDSATWEISEALIPFLASVMSGEEAWDADRTIERAIEIRAGIVKNPKILSFQSRFPSFPHEKRQGEHPSVPARCAS